MVTSGDKTELPTMKKLLEAQAIDHKYTQAALNVALTKSMFTLDFEAVLARIWPITGLSKKISQLHYDRAYSIYDFTHYYHGISASGGCMTLCDDISTGPT